MIVSQPLIIRITTKKICFTDRIFLLVNFAEHYLQIIDKTKMLKIPITDGKPTKNVDGI